MRRGRCSYSPRKHSDGGLRDSQLLPRHPNAMRISACMMVKDEERLLARVASPELSRHLTDCHLRQGTKILTSAQVAGIEGNARGAVQAVKLEDGETIACDADGTLDLLRHGQLRARLRARPLTRDVSGDRAHFF